MNQAFAPIGEMPTALLSWERWRGQARPFRARALPLALLWRALR
jgi:hypothetical protein